MAGWGSAGTKGTESEVGGAEMAAGGARAAAAPARATPPRLSRNARLPTTLRTEPRMETSSAWLPARFSPDRGPDHLGGMEDERHLAEHFLDLGRPPLSGPAVNGR